MTEDINKKIRRKQITALIFSVLIIAVVIIFISNFTTITGHNPAVSTTGKQPDIFEKLGTFLKENPRNLGWFALGVGVFILAASVFNWNWIFKGNSYNLQKIEGISNMFGRGIARIYFGIGGIVCIILGVIIILIS